MTTLRAARPQLAVFRRRLFPAAALCAVPHGPARGSTRPSDAPGIFYFHPWEIDPGQPRIDWRPAACRAFATTSIWRAWQAAWTAAARFRLGPHGPGLCRALPLVPGTVSTPPGAPQQRWPQLTCMAMKSHPAGRMPAPAWDAFVAAPIPTARSSTAPPGARVIERAFGHRTHYLLAERDGADHRRAAAGAGQDAAVRQHADFGAVLRLWRPARGRCARALPRWSRTRAALLASRRRRRWNSASRASRRRLARRRTGRRAPTCTSPSASRSTRRRRGQHEGDPAQAARDGAQGHRARPDLGARPRRRPCCTASTPRACATSARRCSPRAISALLAEAFGDDCDVVTVLDGETPVAVGDEFLFPRRGAALLRRRHGGGARSATATTSCTGR